MSDTSIYGPHGKLEYNDNSTLNVNTVSESATCYANGVTGNYALTTAYGDGRLRLVHGVVGSETTDQALDIMTFTPADLSQTSGIVNTHFNGNVSFSDTDLYKFIGNLEGTASKATSDADGNIISEAYTNCDSLCTIFDKLYNELKA